MTRSRTVTAVLCVTLLFLITGCFNSNGTDETPPSKDAVCAAYLQAAETIRTADNLSVYIGTMTETTINGQTYSLTSQQQLDFRTDSTNGFQASSNETVQIGAHKFTVSELYSGNINYIQINDQKFKSATTAEAFTDRFAPTVLLDCDLYKDIQFEQKNGSTAIAFSQPTGAEPWALPDGAEFLDGQGYAVLNSNGALTESSYTIRYLAGGASVENTVKLIFHSADFQITPPENTESYTPLDCQDAPKRLEEAYGYLLQGTQMQSQSTESIYCQAFSISRSETFALAMSGNADSFFASMDANVTQSNQSSGKKVLKQKELFQNGIYSISSNGGTAVKNTSVDQAAMKAYCQEYLTKNVFRPEQIVSATLSETDSTYKIIIQLDQSTAETICTELCTVLYGEPTLLDTLASSSSIDAVEYILEIDKHTSLPVAASLNFSATHIIETIPYQLTSQRTQSFQYQ